MTKSTRLTIEQYIGTYAALVERELEQVIPSGWHVPDNLKKAMSYSLLAGGKRLRPVLALAAAEAAGGQARRAMPAAVAVELIHTYSLIHDDLPAMDNDDYRRGKLTNHKVFGEAQAILAGDALLTHAFYVLVSGGRKVQLPFETIADMTEELAKLAGASGMVGGQAADMEGEQGLTRLEELDYIHLHKTSDLIVFSLKSGGRCAGASPEQLAALERFGQCLGLAFQIQDDILDLTGDESKLGKPVQSDVKQQKVTYPYFIGLEASQQKAAQLTDEAKRAVQQAGFPDPGRLLELADYLMQRDH